MRMQYAFLEKSGQPLTLLCFIFVRNTASEKILNKYWSTRWCSPLAVVVFLYEEKHWLWGHVGMMAHRS